MKHRLLLSSIIILGLLGCNRQPEKKQPSKEEPSPLASAIPVNCELLGNRLVPLEQAKNWIDNYGRFRDSLQYKDVGAGSPKMVDANVMASAFTLQTLDLLAALDIKVDVGSLRSPHVRCYLGKDEAGNSKLLIVGVINANTRDSSNLTPGINIFFKCNANQHKNDRDDQLYALDLNYPCPNLCPDGFLPVADPPKK